MTSNADTDAVLAFTRLCVLAHLKARKKIRLHTTIEPMFYSCQNDFHQDKGRTRGDAFYTLLVLLQRSTS